VKSFIIILLLTFNCYGNIDDEIDAIKNASSKDKFKLMNNFKKKVIKMQENERILAIQKLATMSKSKKSSHTIKIIKNHINKRDMQGHIENQVEEHIQDEKSDK